MILRLRSLVLAPPYMSQPTSMTESRAGLASLPFEIALQIINCVADPNGSWERRTVSDARYHEVELEHIEPIQNLRLTCRGLWRITTPMLFTALHVSPNYQSIEAFEQLSKNPLIAAHTTRVIVDLKSYRSDMAANLARFKDARFQTTEKHFQILENMMRRNLLEVYGDGLVGIDGKIRADSEHEHREDVKAYRHCQEAWRRLIRRQSLVEILQLMDAGEEAEESLSGLEVALLEAFPEYAKRHQEQIACVNDAQSMMRIAKSISRLACGSKIIFLADAGSRKLDPAATIAGLVNDSKQLNRFLVQPHAWIELHRKGGSYNLETVKVLTRLPVALADAGAPLTKLTIGCFPHLTNEGFANLLLHEGQQPAELETKLRSAFQHLESFSFGNECMTYVPVRRSNLPPADLALIHAYLSAAVASLHLEKLRLSFSTYHLNYDASRRQEPFKLGRVLLSCTAASKLTWVGIGFVQVTQDELQPFLLRLAAGASLDFLSISNTTLIGRGSTWVPALNAIRDAVVQRYGEKRLRVRLSNLRGAELHNTKRTKYDGGGNWTSDSDSDGSSRSPLMKQANAYVKGKTSTNPLLAL